MKNKFAEFLLKPEETNAVQPMTSTDAAVEFNTAVGQMLTILIAIIINGAKGNFDLDLVWELFGSIKKTIKSVKQAPNVLTDIGQMTAAEAALPQQAFIDSFDIRDLGLKGEIIEQYGEAAYNSLMTFGGIAYANKANEEEGTGETPIT